MKYMGPIRQTSEHIQTHGMSLCKTQGALDTLSSRVMRQKGKPGKQFEHCELNLSYLTPDANGLATNKHFITGVIKIQLGVDFEKTMTYLEKQACKCLLKEGVEDDSDDDDSDDEILEFRDTARKNHKRKVSEHTDESKYINCDFIVG